MTSREGGWVLLCGARGAGEERGDVGRRIVGLVLERGLAG